MRQRLANASVLMGFCLMLSSTVYAQVKDSLELNIFGGGSWYSSKKYEIGFPQAIPTVSGKFRLDHAVRAGLRLNVYTRGHWSQEFFYSYEPNKVHLIRQSAPSAQTSLPIQVHNYGIAGLYYLSDDETRSVRPFLSIGLGGTLYRLTPWAESFAHDPLRANLPQMRSSNDLELNYGLGVKTRSSSWLGFRADVHGFLGPTPGFGLARSSSDPTVTVFPASGMMHNAEASAGLVFYFGKP